MRLHGEGRAGYNQSEDIDGTILICNIQVIRVEAIESVTSIDDVVVVDNGGAISIDVVLSLARVSCCCPGTATDECYEQYCGQYKLGFSFMDFLP